MFSGKWSTLKKLFCSCRTFVCYLPVPAGCVVFWVLCGLDQTCFYYKVQQHSCWGMFYLSSSHSLSSLYFCLDTPCWRALCIGRAIWTLPFSSLSRDRHHCVASLPDTFHFHSASPHPGGLIDTGKFSLRRRKVKGGGGGEFDGLVFHPRGLAIVVVTVRYKNSFLSASSC